ncbi:MAG: amino acid permease, partial [Crocinitomicaceae bacterium]|nr:amino acid permease [Crocinitomicaceae bacterium]
AAFGKLHPKFQTPYIANWMLFIFVGAFAALVPGSVAGDLTSFGTLFAFILVCLGILIMRKSNPELKRPFKTPLVPLVPILGILVCTAMIVSLDIATLQAAALWMGLGLIIYFTYSRRNSHLHPKK